MSDLTYTKTFTVITCSDVSVPGHIGSTFDTSPLYRVVTS